MDIQKDNSLVISNFQEGIGQSPLARFSDMNGVSLEKPGIASADFKFQKLIESDGIEDKTFVYTNGEDWGFESRINYRGQENYIPITISSTGDLPDYLEENTIYYIKYVSFTGGTHRYKFYPTLKDAFNGTNFMEAGDYGSGTFTAKFIFPSKITDYTTNNQNQIFALDDNQRVWFLGIGSEPFYLIAGNASGGIGQGIVFYKGWILVFGGTSIDALKNIVSPGTDDVEWENEFITGISGLNKPFYSVYDDYIYFRAGQVTDRYFKIGLLEEIAGQVFDPDDTDTFAYVEDALTIPYESASSQPTVINELGDILVIGTASNKIYFWDKKSPSFTSFIQLPEHNIHDIEVFNNNLYCPVGSKGSFYIANLTSSQLFAKLPEHLSERYNNKYSIDINDFTIYDDKIFVSMSYPFTTTTAKSYIFSIDINNGIMSKFGNSAEGENVERNVTLYSRINKIIPQGDNIFISVQNYDDELGDYTHSLESLRWGANVSATKAYYFNTGRIETGLFSYGDVYNKRTLRTIFISLMRSLKTGEAIKLYYKRDDNDAYTLWKNIDFTTYGAIKEIKVEAPLSNIIDFQVKIEIVGTNTTTPYLKSIRLIP